MLLAPPAYPSPRRYTLDGDALAAKPKNSIASYALQVVPNLPGKAEIFPGTGTIQVDQRFWGGLSSLQQRAVLAHELAHDEDPNASEEETDRRAGARLRWEGVSAHAAQAALGSVVGSRRAGEHLIAGWRAADELIRAQQRERSPDRFMKEGRIGGPPSRRAYNVDGEEFSEGDPDVDGTSFETEEALEALNGSGARPGSPARTTENDGRASLPPGFKGTPPPASAATVSSLLIVAAVVILAIAVVRTRR